MTDQTQPGARRLDGKVAVITGAGAGIGRAIAGMFTAHGGRVVIAEINPDAGAKAAAELNESGGEARFVQTDASSTASTDAMVDEVLDHFGRIDILVNNANARPEFQGFWDISEDTFRAFLEVNVLGMFFLSRRVAERSMVPNRYGRIINISSITGEGYPSFSPGYSSSKGGMNALTWYMAGLLSEHGVNVNAVCPGSVRSGVHFDQVMRDKAVQEGISFEEKLERFAKENPLQRINDVDDIANAVLFLASDDAKNVTGQIIDVDGGRRALSGWMVLRGLNDRR